MRPTTKLASTANQNAEQIARDLIDAQLAAAGWLVQKLKDLNFNAAPALAIREYQTDIGPADYVLFLNKQPIGIVEANPEDWDYKLTTVENQAAGYAAAKLKWFSNNQPSPSSTNPPASKPFHDLRDSKPRQAQQRVGKATSSCSASQS